MAVHFASGWTLPEGAPGLDCARIVHAGNWHVPAVIRATNVDPGGDYFADAVLSSAPYERWKPGADFAFFAMDYSEPVAWDCIVIAAHTLGSSGATVGLWVQRDGTSEYVSIGSVSPSTDEPILWMVPAEPDSLSVRLNVSSADARPELGFVRIATALAMERPAEWPGRVPFHLAREVSYRWNMSQTGMPLARVVEGQSQPLRLSWSSLSQDFAEGEVAALLDALDRDLFVIAARPGERPRDVAFGGASGSRAMPAASGSLELHNLQIDLAGYWNG